MKDTIEEKDFYVTFHGNHWTVEWVWKGKLPALKNNMNCYNQSLQEEMKAEYEKKVEHWIQEGILVP